MKNHKIVFSPHAINDIEEATAYYNQHQKGLGKRFVLQVQQTLKRIKTNSFFAAVRYEDVRCAKISTFPFLIHYTIDEINHTIIIASVYSTYRQPLWKER